MSVLTERRIRDFELISDNIFHKTIIARQMLWSFADDIEVQGYFIVG